MSVIASLAHRPGIIAFDAYGTLFDVHSAVARLRSRMGPDTAAFSAHWRNKQLEYSWVLSLAGVYRDFWQLTGEALDHALASYPSVDAGLRPELLGAYRTLDAYAEVAATLTRLRAAGFTTCIFSNGEPDMLSSAVSHSGMGPRLDAVISVEAARIFKTAPAAYRLITDRFGCSPADVVLVSSNRWDIAGASAFGIRCVWVNRLGSPNEYPGLGPIATVPDLSAL